MGRDALLFIKMNRTVFNRQHTFATERVGWYGHSRHADGLVEISVTYRAGGSEVYMIEINDCGVLYTYWGTMVTVLKFLYDFIYMRYNAKSASDIDFSPEQMMHQVYSRIVSEDSDSE